ncbi:hypothetical protein E4T56_gene4011 [Termitomyces sp. T112]|nr:hypothetical protein E4T56_gene4011 [Termitomyces sp. T112]
MSPSTSGSSSTLTVETFRLGPFLVPRIWTGLWQLSSNAWGTAPVSKIRQEMAKHVERGYTAFDMPLTGRPLWQRRDHLRSIPQFTALNSTRPWGD